MRSYSSIAATSDSAAGVSLLEVVIATAAVAVLAVLATAVFGNVRLASLAVINVGNHRTITAAILAYSADHGGQLPWGLDNDPPFGDGESTSTAYPKTLAWMGYVRDARVFFSPLLWPRYGANGNKSSAMLVLSNPQYYKSAVLPWAHPSYGVNLYGAMPTRTSPPTRRPANLNRVATDGRLSQLMLTLDVYNPLHDTKARPLAGGQYWFVTAAEVPPPELTYRGKVYAAFADGHVVAYPREEMISLLSSTPNFQPPLFKNHYTMGR
ncbi:MAG TPA: hypothetical protein VNQ90_13960 [Chthoniobacteraceae bacterium]|nr:hypothetical protein [Chthoniobacteraceae bacterium]